MIDQFGCVLLFKFVHSSGALAGRIYWATPGGAVDEGETFQAAAIRELQEETGLVRQETEGEVGRRSFELQLDDGKTVWADERFFIVHADRAAISDKGWSDNERDLIADYRWWSAEELQETSDTIFPDALLDLLKAATVSRES